MKKLQQAFDNLRKSHKNIRKAFSKIDDSSIKRILNKYDSPKLRRSIRKHGDGHILHGVPRTIDELTAVDAVILIVMNSPFLSEDSDFDPTTLLHTIPYWRTKGLEPVVYSTRSRRKCRLHFMTWQQDCEIHGINTTHACRNRRFLVKSNPILEKRLREGEKASLEFVDICKDWTENKEKLFLVITDFRRETRNNFNKSISGFLADIESKNRFSTNVWAKKNGKIMEWISGRLP